MFHAWAPLVRRAAGGTMIAAFTSAWYYRPIADTRILGTSADASTRTDRNHVDTDTAGIPILDQGPDRTKENFCSKTNPYIREQTPLLLELARSITIAVATIGIRTFMNLYGTYELVDNDDYKSFVKLVLGEGRRHTPGHTSTHANGRIITNKHTTAGLITVSNHRSLFDDPGVVSGILPWFITLRPKYNRWGICSQEFCFNDALPRVIQGFLGAGQVLPICRGAGINQKLFLDFARHLAAGEWLHIFPEGGVWQLDQLGGRNIPVHGPSSTTPTNKNSNKKGKLKWGVGKLLAHAPVRPRVVPFAHAGIENLLPTDQHGKTTVKKNFFGGEPLHVLVKFGPEIYFEDLIEEHEQRHGPLWIYNDSATSSEDDGDIEHVDVGNSIANKGGEFHRRREREQWVSSEAEKTLYHKIAMRIEGELEELTQHVVTVHKQKTAGTIHK